MKVFRNGPEHSNLSTNDAIQVKMSVPLNSIFGTLYTNRLILRTIFDTEFSNK